MVMFFVGVLTVCWLLNFAAWFLFAALFAVGVAIALLGVNVEGGFVGFFAAAYFVREWSFGFPELILHPATNDDPTLNLDPTHELVGSTGKTSSPLRPTGEAVVGDVTVSVASEDGSLIDAGTEVIVTSYRNRLLRVRPHKGEQPTGTSS